MHTNDIEKSLNDGHLIRDSMSDVIVNKKLRRGKFKNYPPFGNLIGKIEDNNSPEELCGEPLGAEELSVVVCFCCV